MYLFYIDESGEREYTSPGRYFVLTALGVRDRDWKLLNTDVLTLKRTYFGDVGIELKSNWLRIPTERQRLCGLWDKKIPVNSILTGK